EQYGGMGGMGRLLREYLQGEGDARREYPAVKYGHGRPEGPREGSGLQAERADEAQERADDVLADRELQAVHAAAEAPYDQYVRGPEQGPRQLEEVPPRHPEARADAQHVEAREGEEGACPDARP